MVLSAQDSVCCSVGPWKIKVLKAVHIMEAGLAYEVLKWKLPWSFVWYFVLSLYDSDQLELWRDYHHKTKILWEVFLQGQQTETFKFVPCAGNQTLAMSKSAIADIGLQEWKGQGEELVFSCVRD